MILTGIGIWASGTIAIVAVFLSILLIAGGFLLLFIAYDEYKIRPEFAKGKKLVDLNVILGILALLSLIGVDPAVFLAALATYGVIFFFLFKIFIDRY